MLHKVENTLQRAQYFRLELTPAGGSHLVKGYFQDLTIWILVDGFGHRFYPPNLYVEWPVQL